MNKDVMPLDTRVKHEYDKVDINSINNVDFNFMNKDIMPLDTRVKHEYDKADTMPLDTPEGPAYDREEGIKYEDDDMECLRHKLLLNWILGS